MYYAFLANEGSVLYRMNTVDGEHKGLVLDVIGFLRSYTPVSPEAAVKVIPGFSSPGYSFDALAIPSRDVFVYDTGGNPDLTKVSVPVFPAFSCEFSGSESIGDASYRVERDLQISRLSRGAVPFLKIKYSNPVIKAKTRGNSRHFMSYETLEREIRQLEGAPDAFVEFETYTGGIWRVAWDESFTVSDLGHNLSAETVMQFAHDAVFGGRESL